MITSELPHLIGAQWSDMLTNHLMIPIQCNVIVAIIAFTNWTHHMHCTLIVETREQMSLAIDQISNDLIKWNNQACLVTEVAT